MPSERLQKIIAAAGVASRRAAEKMIASGLVEVNGQIVSELGSKADPERDHIRVNGKLLRGAEQHVYLLMNKPKGYVTTVSDPEGRPAVMNLLRGIHARVYPVGRLDYGSEGLLLLTNDGELAHALMKAASHVPKVYLVKIAGVPDEAGLQKLRRGLMIPEGSFRSTANERRANDAGGVGTSAKGKSRFLTAKAVRNDKTHQHNKVYQKEAGGPLKPDFGSSGNSKQRVRTAPAQIRLIKEADNPWYEVTLIEGKNRQIRKMFEEIGHHVEKIRRVKYGPLVLDVPPGEFRRLSLGEIAKLKSAAGVGREYKTH
jgi:23S rRNA pseudouridine2605 synthase